MFLRFGKYDLFTESECRKCDLNRSLMALGLEASGRRGRTWLYVRENMFRISALATWALKHRRQLDRQLLRTKTGQRHRHRHLIIKEFTYIVGAAGMSLSVSRGVEGSNLRLAFDVDGQGTWRCRIGEYLNLSGLPLLYHEAFPGSTQCDLCEEQHALRLCAVCSRWVCRTCSTACDDCGNLFCTKCNQSYCGVNCPAHKWYFHRHPRAK